jgi:DNA-binding response OmpR family regulator
MTLRLNEAGARSTEGVWNRTFCGGDLRNLYCAKSKLFLDETDRPMLETVAIAEDEQDLRELLAEFLSTNGYRVLAAPNAAEFRAMVEFEAIDLAILDINMPGEDGLSLARWLNARGSTGIIFATAVNSAIDRIVGLESGADDYVTKPYHMREMLARIRGLLRRRKMVRAALAGKGWRRSRRSTSSATRA